MQTFFHGLARLMAIFGGAVLAALIVLVCLSVAGRELNGLLHSDWMQGHAAGLADALLALRLPGLWGPVGIGPVNGDYELVEAGIAFAIFAFLPLTQITAGHASVDIFTAWLPRRARRFQMMVIEIAMAVVLVVIALQLNQGMQSKMRAGTTTFLLQFPIWWAYALSLAGAAVAALSGVYVAAMRIGEFVTGRSLLASGAEAGH